MSEILTPLATAAVGYVIYLGRTWVLAHATPRQFAAIGALASQAVTAVEQLTHVANLDNAAKYQAASDALTASAKRLGVRLKPDEVQSFIHSALHDYRQVEQMHSPVAPVLTPTQ